MADISVLVDPDGTGDYTSLSSAESTEQATYADLVADGNTMTFNNTSSSGTADTQYVTIAGWTAGVSNNITINNNDDHGGKWNTSAGRISVNSSNNGLNIQVAYTQAIGLQVENVGASARRGITSNVDGVLLSRCIVRLDTTYSSAQCYQLYGSGTNYMKNCLGYGFGSNGGRVGILADNGTVYAYNCNMLNLSTGGFDESSDGTINAKNCVAFNAGTPYDVTTANYCAYDSGSDPGTNGIDISTDAGTDLFLDYTNDDFHIKTSSSLNVSGENLSSDANLVVTEDIDQDTRTNYNIGIDELITAGGSAIMSQLQKNNLGADLFNGTIQ